MSSKTLHSLKTDAHANSLPTEADIRPVASALSFPLLMSLSIALGMRRLVHLDPRPLLAPGCVVGRRHRLGSVDGVGMPPRRRSEGTRVGIACVSTCRTRRSMTE